MVKFELPAEVTIRGVTTIWICYGFLLDFVFIQWWKRNIVPRQLKFLRFDNSVSIDMRGGVMAVDWKMNI